MQRHWGRCPWISTGTDICNLTRGNSFLTSSIHNSLSVSGQSPSMHASECFASFRYQLNIIWSLKILDSTTFLVDTSLFPHFVHKERGHGQSDFSWTVVALYSYVPLMSVFLCIITSELCRLPYCSSTIKKIDNNGINPEYSITERGWFGIRSQIICIVSRVSGKGWNDSESMFWNEFSIIMTY